MAIDQSTRMKVEAELRLGKKSKELSEKYGLPYITIRGWAKKIESMQADEDIDKLITYDEGTLHNMVEELATMPNKAEVKKAVKLVDDAVGLQRLEEKTRSIALTILKGVEGHLAFETDLQLKDYREAAGIVSTLHTALFSKNTTQINVLNNNNISSEKREIFKSSLGA